MRFVLNRATAIVAFSAVAVAWPPPPVAGADLETPVFFDGVVTSPDPTARVTIACAMGPTMARKANATLADWGRSTDPRVLGLALPTSDCTDEQRELARDAVSQECKGGPAMASLVCFEKWLGVCRIHMSADSS